MNETLKVIEERRSCRNFDPNKKVAPEIVEKIVRAGTYAPTGKGKQSPIIIVVENKEVRDRLMKENREIFGIPEITDPFYGAPTIIIVLAKKSIRTHVYDGSVVMENMMLAAESLGVDSIWIHRAKEEFESDYGKELLQGLGITEEYEGIGHCAIGYRQGEKLEAKPRKDNYVYYIK